MLMMMRMMIVMDQSRVSNRAVSRLAITVSRVHSLVTDHPHNPPLLADLHFWKQIRTCVISCLLLWSRSFSSDCDYCQTSPLSTDGSPVFPSSHPCWQNRTSEGRFGLIRCLLILKFFIQFWILTAESTEGSLFPPWFTFNEMGCFD